jgi:hypothetical protein
MSGSAVEPIAAGGRRWLVPAGVVLLVGLELALVAAHPRLPSNDGPAHQYSAWVAHRLANDPGDPLAAAFVLNPRRIYPNAAYSWFLQSLAGALPMPLAERLGAGLYLLALPLSVGLFARALGREPWLPALAAAALALGFPFFMGFFGFLWGVPLVFLFWAALIRVRERPDTRGLLAANALAALVFCAHLVAFVVAIVGGVALIASGARRMRSWLALAGMLPVAVLSPWFWPRTVGASADLRWTEGPLERLVSTLTLGVGSSFGGAERAGAALAGLGLTAVVAVALARGARSPGRRLAPLLLVLLALALFAPSAVGSGSFLAERLMLFAWLAAGAALGALGGRCRSATALAVLSLALAHLGFLEARCREFDREMSVYLSALDRIPAGSALYAFVHTNPHRDFVAQPIVTAACHYHLALGSPNFGLYQAAPPDAPYFPIQYTKRARRRFPSGVPRGHLALGRAGPWADYLLVWKAPERELARVQASGRYRIEFENGPLRLYRRSATGAAPGRPLGRAGGD